MVEAADRADFVVPARIRQRRLPRSLVSNEIDFDSLYQISNAIPTVAQEAQEPEQVVDVRAPERGNLQGVEANGFENVTVE